MKSFFFIPASKSSKINSIKDLGVDHIIIDFEDSVLEKDRLKAFEDIIQFPDYLDFWYRVPLRNSFDENINLKYLRLFEEQNINKFIFPKLKTKQELTTISNSLTHKIKFILLVEHPRFLFDLEAIFRENIENMKLIGVGLGSHDLTSTMNTAYSEKVLNYPKSYLTYLSKAFQIINIDVASMELKDSKKFQNEVEIAKEFNYDAKFLIHPTQMNWFKNLLSMDDGGLEWAETIINALPNNFNIDQIEPFVLKGKIIEKMHIQTALKTINKKKDGK
ncbi:MAG: aldolase/citrate lyase family protein [Aequorivita sp.]